MKEFEPAWTHVSFKFKKSLKTPSHSYRQFFGFAKLKDSAAQQKAITEYSGKELQGRVVKIAAVSIEKPKAETEATDKAVESKKVAEVNENSQSETAKEATKPVVADAAKEVAKENVVPQTEPEAPKA